MSTNSCDCLDNICSIVQETHLFSEVKFCFLMLSQSLLCRNACHESPKWNVCLEPTGCCYFFDKMMSVAVQSVVSVSSQRMLCLCLCHECEERCGIVRMPHFFYKLAARFIFLIYNYYSCEEIFIVRLTHLSSYDLLTRHSFCYIIVFSSSDVAYTTSFPAQTVFWHDRCRDSGSFQCFLYDQKTIKTDTHAQKAY
jgi:hypothetical protein